jgi:hypothetical protein
MEKSDNHYQADMAMIRIQALEWTQGQIQDLILNNVTTDWPLYNDEEVQRDLKYMPGYGNSSICR